VPVTPMASQPRAQPLAAMPGYPQLAQPPPMPPVMPSGPYGHAVMPGGMRPMPPAFAPPAGNHTTLLIIVGAVVASAIVAVILIIATRNAGPDKEASTEAHTDQDTSDKSQRDEPAGSAGRAGRDDPWASASTLSGTTVSVGQGVQLVLPASFGAPKGKNGYIVASDNRGIFIVTGPVGVAGDDPQQLAAAYARDTSTTLDGINEIFVGGVKRPMGFFHGLLKDQPYGHIAVPLIGQSYRIVVSVVFPTKYARDKSVQAELLELYTRRIILP
jgi:hypothetical protein